MKTIRLTHDDYFTSDTHFLHRRICELANRPFASIDEHDAALVDRWNAKVPKHARVFHLGDVTLGDLERAAEILRSLNGSKFLVWGNHDPWARKTGTNGRALRACFVDMRAEIQARHPNGHRVCMFHYPQVTWNGAHRGAWHLHGHCHGTLAGFHIAQPRSGLSLRPYYHAPVLDVGVDARALAGMNHDYAPWSLEEIELYMRDRSYGAVDQHGATNMHDGED